MKILLVHYHFRDGGVNRVIERQIDGLSSLNIPIAILCGSGASSLRSFPDLEIYEIAECDYLDMPADHSTLHRVESVLKNFFLNLPRDVVVHIHNPFLGKNPVLSSIIVSEALKGRAVVFQCHDFAEDRPSMLKNLSFYGGLTPDKIWHSVACLKNVSICFVNRHDMRRELKVKPCYLPNPVDIDRRETYLKRGDIADTLKLAPKREWWIYPVRAIARKNIGELALLAIINRDIEWLITLAPENEQEISLYSSWCSLFKELGLSIHCDVAKKVPFPDLMYNSDRAITTSVKEGFGMAFLEPWLWGIPVSGRRLDDVVIDFEDQGIRFTKLYSSIEVPGVGDFGMLDPVDQQRYIRICHRSKKDLDELISANRDLMAIFSQCDPLEVDLNREAVNIAYSTEAHANQLLCIYGDLLKGENNDE